MIDNTPSPTPPVRILLLEDSAVDAALLRDLLHAAGQRHEFVHVTHRKAFEEALSREPFDLILCDYSLPDIDGLTALKLARQKLPETPILIVSGSIDSLEAVECLQQGATDYVQKQRMERLPSAVGRALREAKELRTRLKAEADLRESERFARASLDALSSHIAVVDADGVILTTNRAWRDFAEQNGQSWQHVSEGANYLDVCDRAGGDEGAQAAAIVRDVISGRRTEGTFEYPCHSPNKQRWFFCRITRFPGQGPVRVVLSHTDITARKQAEFTSQRTQKQFQDLFEFAPDAIVMANREGLIAMVNKQAERLFGYERGELLGEPVEKLMRTSQREGPAALRQLFLATATPRTMSADRQSLLGTRKDGTDFPVDISLSPLESEAGTVVAAAIRDVSERERALRQTLRTQRLESIGTLASGVAHDLNNALAPILLISELLRMQYPDAVEMIGTVESSARRAAAMVRQLLTFARGVEGERLLIEPEQLLNEMENIIKSTFPNDIRVRTTQAKQLHRIIGDSTQLHQVLLNLCVNARDAMPGGGVLTLQAENEEIDETFASTVPDAKPGRYLAWRVSDTGAGIPPEIMERIFEPFFSTKPPEQGTGLGLSTCLGIVRSHGGFVRAYSSEGRGSTFAVYLPAGGSGTGHTPPRQHDAVIDYRGSGETILVVDDEPAVLSTADSVLTAMNFNVVLAADGAEALSQVAQRQAELRVLITDVHMPHVDGLTLVRAFKRMVPDAVVIVTSGRMEQREVSEFEALGVSAVLDKPFTQQQLAAVLKRTLQG